MKRFYLVLMVWLLFYATLFAKGTYKVISQRSLNVRSLPTTDAKILGSIPSETFVEVLSIKDGWAEIMFNGQHAYISAKYISLVKSDKSEIENKSKEPAKKIEPVPLPENTTNDKAQKERNPFYENWGLDLLPSMHVGISGFMGGNGAIPHCGFGIGTSIQLYQKSNDKLQGYMAEVSLNYALKGAGGLHLHYFNIIMSPGGYAYTFNKQEDITLYALVGCIMDVGGGSLYAYAKGYPSKQYYAYPIDFGLQLKFAAEWRQFGCAISYNQGFLNVIENSPLSIKNYGINFHFSYRLWNLLNNNIYKP